MQLIPAVYLDLVVGPGWRTRFGEACASGVKVANRVEVDLGLIDDGSVVSALIDYQARCREVARALASGEEIGPWIIVETVRHVGVQQAGTKSAQRGDLGEEFAGLMAEPETAHACAALLGSTIDEARLCELGAILVREGDVKSTLELRVEGSRSWTQALGGSTGPNEIERHFLLSANHAAWRDRQVRRLTRIEVKTLELLADPTPCRAACSV